MIKNTHFYLTILASFLFITGCDTREDVFEISNTIPTSTIQSENNWSPANFKEPSSVIFDSVKFGFDYSYKQKITDDSKNLVIKFNTKNNSRLFQKKGVDLIPHFDSLETNLSNIDFSLSVMSVGREELTITTFDPYRKSYVNELYLTCFDNMLPKSIFKITKISTISNRTYEIDASGSYDMDAKFGGAITEYYFEIKQSTSILFSSYKTIPKFTFTFLLPGSYDVSVKVKDNNNIWSNLLFKNLIIT